MKMATALWVRLSENGIQPGHHFEEIRRIRILNQFCFFTCVVSSAYVVFLLAMGSPYLAVFDFLIFAFALLVFFLNRYVNFDFAFAVLYLTIPLSLLLISREYGMVAAEYYSFPLIIMAYLLAPKNWIAAVIITFQAVLFVFAKYYQETVVPMGLTAVLRPWFYFVNLVASFLMGGIFLRLFILTLNRHQRELENKQVELEMALNETQLRNMEITVLLRELNHRTKNNLQLVSSLIGIQTEHLPPSESRDLLRDIRVRIFAMALVHQKLYSGDTLISVSVRDYFEELLDHLLSMFNNPDDPVVVESHIDEFTLPIDHAVSVGLLINELLTNSFKYGLRHGGDKEIEVDIRKSGLRDLDIIYGDSGTGMKRMMEREESETFGAELIQTLIRQMNGTFQCSDRPTNKISIQLKVDA